MAARRNAAVSALDKLLLANDVTWHIFESDHDQGPSCRKSRGLQRLPGGRWMDSVLDSSVPLPSQSETVVKDVEKRSIAKKQRQCTFVYTGFKRLGSPVRSSNTLDKAYFSFF